MVTHIPSRPSQANSKTNSPRYLSSFSIPRLFLLSTGRQFVEPSSEQSADVSYLFPAFLKDSSRPFPPASTAPQQTQRRDGGIVLPTLSDSDLPFICCLRLPVRHLASGGSQRRSARHHKACLIAVLSFTLSPPPHPRHSRQHPYSLTQESHPNRPVNRDSFGRSWIKRVEQQHTTIQNHAQQYAAALYQRHPSAHMHAFHST